MPPLITCGVFFVLRFLGFLCKCIVRTLRNVQIKKFKKNKKNCITLLLFNHVATVAFYLPTLLLDRQSVSLWKWQIVSLDAPHLVSAIILMIHSARDSASFNVISYHTRHFSSSPSLSLLSSSSSFQRWKLNLFDKSFPPYTLPTRWSDFTD